MLGLLVPHYARVVCGGIEMYHKGKVVSVEVGSYLSTSTPVFVIDNGLSVGKSLESLVHHAGWQPRSLASAKDFFAQPCVRAPSCFVTDDTLPDLDSLELKTLPDSSRSDHPRDML
jgi:DNA-binding NtrC family response regulator